MLVMVIAVMMNLMVHVMILVVKRRLVIIALIVMMMQSSLAYFNHSFNIQMNQLELNYLKNTWSESGSVSAVGSHVEHFDIGFWIVESGAGRQQPLDGERMRSGGQCVGGAGVFQSVQSDGLMGGSRAQTVMQIISGRQIALRHELHRSRRIVRMMVIAAIHFVFIVRMVMITIVDCRRRHSVLADRNRNRFVIGVIGIQRFDHVVIFVLQHGRKNGLLLVLVILDESVLVVAADFAVEMVVQIFVVDQLLTN